MLQYFKPKAILFLSFTLFWLGSMSAQIEARVDVAYPEYDTAGVIFISWPEEVERDWHVANDGKLDIIGLQTRIASERLKKSASGITTFTFQFSSPCAIEFLFSLKTIGAGEQLYLADRSTGHLVMDLAQASGKTILTSDVDPERIMLVWKSNEAGHYTSVFHIDQIYYQLATDSRTRGIGFGTALACHPNTACKQDSMLKLISASTVRIRLVMEEGIGWCTGSFVNNTRNDKTPYLLTAYHCQYEYTPRYDMWRFDFDYASATCENPASEPSFFSLTGCELISLGQASDFLLVRLDDTIPADREVTFAGWNRDDMATPDTSYLIHDPNADIRKISTCTTPATIHPNQIGWTEGYTTPAFHHFRLKFTEGGHEHGSSGGPLFDQDGYLVGQLHGGTSGCEDINNAYVGRLAKSWNLGATPQSRLRDWLDPDQTGQVQIPSLPNIVAGQLMTIHGQITDPSGRPVKNTMITVSGGSEQTLMTDADGLFEITSVPRTSQYIITPSKTDNPTNGVNAIDLIAIQKHLLGKDTFDLDWQYIAADATNNASLSVGDIVLLQRLLLGKIQVLPSSPSWRFDPPQYTVEPLPSGVPDEVQFKAIKIGDLNGNADPQK